jgi:hypothetical protein
MTFTIEIVNHSGLPLRQFANSPECQQLIKNVTLHRLQPYYPNLVEVVKAFIEFTKGVKGGAMNGQ